ncbi:SpoIID/LytB domain-containing protein [Caloramator quimbayensis]|nr:SpoIID/LytB domain-containing protein [Caloramator quimbayensis]
MKRRIIAFTVVFLFIFSSISLALDSNLYFQDLRIGLENMSSNSLQITLNGDYKFNDNIMLSGTSHVLNINIDKINMDGIDYDGIVLIPQNKDNTLTLKAGLKTYSYIGTIEFTIKSGNIVPINIVNIEDYLKGVVPYEMSNSYPLEALKAQAVAARNYAIANIGKHKDRGYDLCDTTDCQVYRGYNSNYNNSAKAVEDTRGIVLLYNEKLVDGYYAASNGGYTEDSSNIWSKAEPYLKTKIDEFDNENWPYGDMSFKSSDIDLKLKSKGYIKSDCSFLRIDLSSIKKYDSARVASIDVIYKDMNGIEQRLTFTKDRARTFLSLPSSMYDVTYDESIDTYTFKGKGYGHGIGMSQIGAKNRAIAGQNYDSILNFYYDGTYLINLLNQSKNIIINKNKFVESESAFITYDGDFEGYLYKYVIEKDGNVVFVRDYSKDKTLTYKCDKAGNYKIHLYIRYNDSQNTYDEEKSAEFIIETGTVNNSQSSSVPNDTNGTIPSDNNESTQNNKDSSKTTTEDITKPSDTNTKQDSNTSKESLIRTLNISRSLTKGMKGNDVKALQEYLKILGYKVDINGTFDNKTYTAVVDFQKKNKITSSGIVGIKTVTALNKAVTSRYVTTVIPSRGESEKSPVVSLSISGILKKGSSGEQVKKLQEALKYLSYNIDVNGKFDSKTEAAVKQFQKSNKLVSDGIVGNKTIQLLEQKLRLR